MKPRGRNLSTALACALLLPAGAALPAQNPKAGSAYVGGIPGATPGRVTGIGVGISAAGALIGVGVYYAVKHNHSVTGCARSGQDGLQLNSDSDRQTYALVGVVASVSRKKGNEESAATREFLAEKVSRDLGKELKSPDEQGHYLHPELYGISAQAFR